METTSKGLEMTVQLQRSDTSNIPHMNASLSHEDH